jgi:hypothetical protein
LLRVSTTGQTDASQAGPDELPVEGMKDVVLTGDRAAGVSRSYLGKRKRIPEEPLTRVETHKIHHTIAATRQTEARKFRASLS